MNRLFFKTKKNENHDNSSELRKIMITTYVSYSMLDSRNIAFIHSLINTFKI